MCLNNTFPLYKLLSLSYIYNLCSITQHCSMFVVMALMTNHVSVSVLSSVSGTGTQRQSKPAPSHVHLSKCILKWLLRCKSRVVKQTVDFYLKPWWVDRLFFWGKWWKARKCLILCHPVSSAVFCQLNQWGWRPVSGQKVLVTSSG